MDMTTDEPMRQIIMGVDVCDASLKYHSYPVKPPCFYLASEKAVKWKKCCQCTLLCCCWAEKRRRKKLMTGHFHVSYRDALSGRSRWARQSTTRSPSSEPSFICLITSPRLYSSGEMRLVVCTFQTTAKKREGGPERQISLVLFKKGHLLFYEEQKK